MVTVTAEGAVGGAAGLADRHPGVQQLVHPAAQERDRLVQPGGRRRGAATGGVPGQGRGPGERLARGNGWPALVGPNPAPAAASPGAPSPAPSSSSRFPPVSVCEPST